MTMGQSARKSALHRKVRKKKTMGQSARKSLIFAVMPDHSKHSKMATLELSR